MVPSQCASEVLNDLVTLAVEEVNYIECKEELVINQNALDSMESMNMEHNHTVFCKPNHCAGTLVMETGPADDLAVDCSEGASASNTHDNNATAATICCINWTPCYEYTTDSQEETNGKRTFVSSQKQVILQNNDISVNEEEAFRDLRGFASYDNEASHNESLFGVSSSHKRDVTCSSHSYKAKVLKHNEVHRADKSQSHQRTLPHLSSSKNVMQQGSNNTIAMNDHKNETVVTGYSKPSYSILVGNFVKVYPTNLFASLPQHDKFLVKERQHDPTTGFTKAKLVLKSSSTGVERNKRCTVLTQMYLDYYTIRSLCLFYDVMHVECFWGII